MFPSMDKWSVNTAGPVGMTFSTNTTTTTIPVGIELHRFIGGLKHEAYGLAHSGTVAAFLSFAARHPLAGAGAIIVSVFILRHLLHRFLWGSRHRVMLLPSRFGVSRIDRLRYDQTGGAEDAAVARRFSEFGETPRGGLGVADSLAAHHRYQLARSKYQRRWEPRRKRTQDSVHR
jgi:hypothetical protein